MYVIHTPCVPSPSDVPSHPLLVSEVKEIIVEVKSPSSEVVRKVKRLQPVYTEIPAEELENRGVHADFTLIPNLQKAGITPQVVTRPFYGLSLESRAAAVEQLNSFDDSVLESVNSESSELESSKSE